MRLGVRVGVAVSVGVSVTVGVKVSVGVRVTVAVLVGRGVSEGTAVAVGGSSACVTVAGADDCEGEAAQPLTSMAIATINKNKERYLCIKTCSPSQYLDDPKEIKKV